MTAPDHKPKEPAEEFLSRWSRRKQQAREEVPAPAKTPVVQPDEPPPLPALDQLNADSDYRGFLHPKVDEKLRRAALKKLFSDPHFNIMDGLDTYIDDYSISEPIPAAMLAEMKSAQNILAWARETEEEAAVRRALPPAGQEPEIAELPPESESEAIAKSPAEDAPAESATAEPGPAKPESGQQIPKDDTQNA